MKKNLGRNPIYQGKQVIILLLSLYVVLEFFVSLVVEYSPRTIYLLEVIDFVVCCLFIADLIYEAWRSGDRLYAYVRKHLLEIASATPFLTSFRLLRVLNIFKIIRTLQVIKLLRGFKGIGPVIRYATQNRLRSTLSAYILLMIMILLFCASGFYTFEKGVNENVTSYLDAIWWAFMTASSVGDALIYPTTWEGRTFAAILVISGIGLFSLITADLSTNFVMYFINRDKKKEGRDKGEG
jgi:voltage-gated potassium channel